MLLFPPTIILRHRRENLKKCSLRGLEKRPDCIFLTYPQDSIPDLTQYILLSLDAPPLSPDDNSCGLFLIDSTWSYTPPMRQKLPAQIQCRSLPSHFRTAYPRRQDDCADPERGLASVEALYLAYHILGRDPEGLLDGYYWKDPFLKTNKLEAYG
jgi:pre-rRNA-processing protein TSR3